MSKISLPPVSIIHYVDPLCPWTIPLERTTEQLKEIYGDRIKVQYKVCIAVDDINSWMKHYGFDEKSLADFHRQIARDTKVDFDPEFVTKTGFKTSREACYAFKAALIQNEELASDYLKKLLNTFIVKAEKFSINKVLDLAKSSQLDEKKIAKDMVSMKITKLVEEDMQDMEKRGATFSDLVIINSEGQSRLVKNAFIAEKVVNAIEKISPGLPKHTAKVTS
jgi:predicted DsbA family dithiol-disulfide isomerase